MSISFKYSRKDIIGAITVACIFAVLLIILKSSRTGDLGPPRHEYSNSFASETEIDSVAEIPREIDFFNPNNLEQKEWEDLGFTQKQASSIVRYHENYGPFKKASDVAKIYVISDEKFQELQPFMIFETAPLTEPSLTSEVKNDEAISLEININTATSEELEQIRGIGEVYASRVIKFRNILGGFSTKKQYQEVYGLSPESRLSLEQNTLIDLSNLKKINMNTASKTELKKHPYFKKWEVIAAILTERETNELSNLDFLLDQNLINEEEMEKMIPYASF